MENKKSKKIAVIILIALLVVFVFFGTLYFGEKKNRAWDSGVVMVNGQQISLPISIDEFEKSTGLTVSEDSKNAFRPISLDGVLYEKITVYVPENNIIGISVRGEDARKVFDEFPGKLISFPKEVSTNSSLAEIESAYSTGIFEFFKRKSVEKPGGNFNGAKTVTIKYAGDIYDMSVTESTHKTVERDNVDVTVAIFYYAK